MDAFPLKRCYTSVDSKECRRIAVTTSQRTRKRTHRPDGRNSEGKRSGAGQRTKRTRGRQTGRPRREPTAHAEYALEAFAGLSGFFRNNAQLGEALGWDEKTVAEWKDRKVVRPRKPNILRVAFLHELCLEARAYLVTEADAGQWVTAPQPQLGGATPAAWVRERGKTGLDELTRMFVDTVVSADDDLEQFDADEVLTAMARSAETDPAAAEVQRMLEVMGSRRTGRTKRELASA